MSERSIGKRIKEAAGNKAVQGVVVGAGALAAIGIGAGMDAKPAAASTPPAAEAAAKSDVDVPPGDPVWVTEAGRAIKNLNAAPDQVRQHGFTPYHGGNGQDRLSRALSDDGFSPSLVLTDRSLIGVGDGGLFKGSTELTKDVGEADFILAIEGTGKTGPDGKFTAEGGPQFVDVHAQIDRDEGGYVTNVHDYEIQGRGPNDMALGPIGQSGAGDMKWNHLQDRQEVEEQINYDRAGQPIAHPAEAHPGVITPVPDSMLVPPHQRK